MAQEIIGTRTLNPNGRIECQMLYTFPIDGPILDQSGNPIVPAFNIDGIPPALRSQLSPKQLDDLNQSVTGYVVTSLTQAAGEDDAAFSDRALTDYTAVSAYVLQQRRDEAQEAAMFNKRRFTIDAK